MKITRFFILLHCILLSATYVYSQSEYVECSTARFLCDKDPLFIPYLSSKVNVRNVPAGTCFPPDFTETNIIWLKWKIEKPGDLSFTILPIVDSDDIDFVLYRLSSFENCTDKEAVRCIASGPNLGEDTPQRLLCTGATGLRAEAMKQEQPSGCPDNSDNFLRPVQTRPGEFYALVINNFRSSKGIQIEWGGSATFEKAPGICSPRSDDSNTANTTGSETLKLSEPYPNPSTQTVRIQTQSDVEHSGQLVVISSEGYIEKTQPFLLPAGNGMLEINAHDLRPGIYFIKIKMKDDVYSLRFVKH